MSLYKPCPECGLSTLHLERCSLKPKPPLWRCWDPELGDEEDGEDYRAYNPEIAAEAFAQAQCSDDADCYQIYADESREIRVKGADGEVKSFEVSGEPSFTFHARPKDTP